MRTLTPLERRILTTIDNERRRWWTLLEIAEELEHEPYISLVSSLQQLRRHQLVGVHVAGIIGDTYSITPLGQAELDRRAA
jgi:predicted MarR family transcription regulator